MNKHRRHELKMLKYKKRMRVFAATSNVFVKADGSYIYSPKTIDVINANAQTSYRSHSTPCSCYMCSPDKYNRAKEKRNTREHIIEDHEVTYYSYS